MGCQFMLPLHSAPFSAKSDCCTYHSEFAGCSEVFDLGRKKPAVQTGGQKNIKRKLEPEYASNIKTAAGSQIRSWNGVASELWKRKRVSKGVRTCILDKRIDGCEVRVIESIQRSKAEFERCPLVELDLLGHACIEEVKEEHRGRYCVAHCRKVSQKLSRRHRC